MILPLFTLLLVVAEVTGRLSPRAPRTPKLAAWAWVLGLVASYAVQLAIVRYAATHQFGMPAWRAAMPIPAIDDRGLVTVDGNAVTIAMLALGALQAYALLALYRARVAPGWVWGGCLALLALSLAAPALTSFDIYGYVRGAMLGVSAYTPQDVPFTGDYHVLNEWFGGATYTLYGPLWIVLAKIVTAAAPTLLAKLMAYRIFGALLFGAFVAGLRACGLPPRLLAVAALNPGLMHEYVANAHNDFICIVALVFAAALIRARPAVGFGLIAVAGLVKLPYVLFGLPVAAAVRPAWARYAGCAAMAAVVLALSWFGGGAAYFLTVFGHVGSRSADVVHRLAGLTAVLAILFALAGGRRLRTAAWAMPQIAAAVFAWYLVWGLPYALASRRALGYLLVCFPLAAVLFESAFYQFWEMLLIVPLLAILSLRSPQRKAVPA